MKNFTEKQETYMRYLAQGLNNSEIAEKLGVAVKTVIVNYQDRMIFKTYLCTKDELVAYAKQHYGVQTNS